MYGVVTFIKNTYIQTYLYRQVYTAQVKRHISRYALCKTITNEHYKICECQHIHLLMPGI